MNRTESKQPATGHAEPSPAPRRVSSSDLLPSGRPLHIEHGGDLYILRQTSNGKLILTQ